MVLFKDYAFDDNDNLLADARDLVKVLYIKQWDGYRAQCLKLSEGLEKAQQAAIAAKKAFVEAVQGKQSLQVRKDKMKSMIAKIAAFKAKADSHGSKTEKMLAEMQCTFLRDFKDFFRDPSTGTS